MLILIKDLGEGVQNGNVYAFAASWGMSQNHQNSKKNVPQLPPKTQARRPATSGVYIAMGSPLASI